MFLSIYAKSEKISEFFGVWTGIKDKRVVIFLQAYISLLQDSCSIFSEILIL